jgi:aspartate racemase
MIGIVGGMGPYAGLDLLRKIYDNTVAGRDQEHLDTILLSLSSRIGDRTEYLMGEIGENPGLAIADVLIRLEESGAVVAGIPCNTAHADSIYNAITAALENYGSSIHLLHIIGETIAFIQRTYPDLKRVGVLSTTGTLRSGLYRKALEAKGYSVLEPDPEMQKELIHPAMHHPEYGIKAQSNPVCTKARENLLTGFYSLKERGAEIVILGCTEIPIAFPEPEVEGIQTLDPTNVLARALISHIDPDKLKPN